MNETPLEAPSEQPSVATSPQIVTQEPIAPPPDPVKPRFYKTKKFWIITIALLLLVAGGVTYALLKRNKGNQATSEVPAASQQVSKGDELSLAPRFTSVSDYLKDGDAELYAVPGGIIHIRGSEHSVFTHADGLPSGSPTAIVKFKDKLWVSTQEGVAVLDAQTGKFASSKNAIQNGHLFYDKYGDRLFLSEFTGFYELVGGQWQKIEGPVDISTSAYFAAGKDNIVVTANRDSSPVWVLDRKTNTWKLNKPKSIDDQVATVFVLNDQVFIAGRSVGYVSCESAGKVTATSAERLDENETWHPLTAFNSDKARPELRQISVSTSGKVMFETSSCADSSKTTSYDVSYDGTTLQLNNPNQIDRNSGFLGVNEVEQEQLIKRISDVTKLPPYLEVLNVAKDGNILIAYSEELDASSTIYPNKLAVLKQGKLTDRQEIKHPQTGYAPTTVPVTCGVNQTVEYIFLGVEEDAEGGPTGTWHEAKLYPLKDAVLGTPIDVKDSLSAAVFACNDTTVSWIGKTRAQQLNRKTNTMTSIGGAVGNNLDLNSVSVAPTTSGNLWALVTSQDKEQAGTLYRVDAAAGKTTKVGTVPARAVLGANDQYVWVGNGTDGYGAKGVGIFRVDAAGAQSAKIDNVNLAWATFLSNGVSLVQTQRSGGDSVYFPVDNYSVSAEGAVSKLDGNDLPIRFSYIPAGPGVVDMGRSKLWLTDAQYGTFSVKIPQ